MIMENNELKFIAFKEGKHWIAQGIDIDLCTQAPDMETLKAYCGILIREELADAKEDGKEAFGDIGPAPEHVLRRCRFYPHHEMTIQVPTTR